MGFGMLGAIGGVGGAMQDLGKRWSQEAKEKRIMEAKEKYKLEAEGRAEKRALDAEGRAEERALDAEGRANAEYDRRQGLSSGYRTEEKENELRLKREDDLERDRLGITRTSKHRPRSPYEGRDQWLKEKKEARESGEDPAKFPSYEEWSKSNSPVAEPKGELNGVDTRPSRTQKPEYKIPEDLAEKNIDARRFASLKAYLDKGHTAEDARAVWRSQGKDEWIIDRMLEELGVEE